MPKPSTNISLNEDDLLLALNRLNLFYSDESMWFPTWAKKEHVDLFDVPIPIGANYFKRSIGLRSRPIMILSECSLARLHYCLSTANSQFEALAKDLAEKEHLLIEEDKKPPGSGAG